MKKSAVTLESLDTRVEGLDSRLESLDSRMDQFDSKLDQLDQKIDKIDFKFEAKIDVLDKKIDTKFDILDQKIDSKFDQLFDFLSENTMMRPEIEKVIEENNATVMSSVLESNQHYAKQYKNTDEEVLALQHRVTLIEKHVGM